MDNTVFEGRGSYFLSTQHKATAAGSRKEQASVHGSTMFGCFNLTSYRICVTMAARPRSGWLVDLAYPLRCQSVI
jgi:hypothetical protein